MCWHISKRLLLSFLLVTFQLIHVQAGSLDNYQLVEQKLPMCFTSKLGGFRITNMIEDKNGFIWITCSDGLVRFDGYEFKYFRHDKNNPNSISSSSAYRICKDSKGNIWIGMINGGLSCYNPLTNTFRNYSVKSVEPGTNDPIMALFVDKQDEVWCSISLHGLSHLNKEKGTFETFDVVTAQRCPNTKPHKIPLHNFVMDIEDRDNDNLWLGTPEGLFSFNKIRKEFTVMRPKFSKELHHDIYNAEVILKERNYIWTGGWGSGLQCFDTLTKIWTDYSIFLPEDHINNNGIISSVTKKDDDELWIGTEQNGLGTFDLINHKFHFLKDDSAYKYLPKSYANYVFTDHQNNLYVSYQYKVCFFSQKPNLFRKYTVPSYPNINFGITDIYTLFEDETKRYLYSGNGNTDPLIRFDKFTNQTEAVQLALNNKPLKLKHVLQLLRRDSNSLWLLTVDKLYIYYYQSGKVVLPVQPKLLSIPQGTNSYSCIEKAPGDILWLGTSYTGFIRYNISTGESENISKDVNDTLQMGTIYGHLLLCDKKNNIWYGNTRSSLLACYNPETNKSTYYDKTGHKCTRQNSVPIYSFYSDDKYVYASTMVGLFVFDVETGDPKIETIYNSDNGLTVDAVLYSQKENDSIIWLSCGNGVLRYNLNSNLYRTITNEDGLGLGANCFFSVADNSIFITSNNSIYEYLPNIKLMDPIAVSPVLTNFNVNENEINYYAALLNKNQITIESDYSYFSVSYASLDYANTQKIRYNYMLEGIHKNWIDAGDRRYATFSNLSGGNYILKLRSTVDNGATYSEITTIPIFIETIYYKTLWFRLLIVIVLSVLLFAIYHYRTQQQKAIDDLNSRAQFLEKEKSVVQYENLKQQLNPHFLFNSLTSLSSLISIDPKTARQFVDQMSKIYRYILKSSEHETVPLINEINFASTYVKLQQTRFENGFIVNINVGEEYNDRKIVPVTIQNMIENAIKHNIIDEESPLVVDVFVENDYLVVKNNLQKKGIVETSNKQGLDKMKSLYKYLSDKPIIINETEMFYEIRIPLV